MAKDDYATVGGSLRLKGSGGVLKHRSKKKSRSKRCQPEDPSSETPKDATKVSSNDAGATTENNDRPPSTSADRYKDTRFVKHKTDAERKFEEARKKKLDQLLLKDAEKSHKERVEEFNKKLANLSEHHDMPRIGPG